MRCKSSVRIATATICVVREKNLWNSTTNVTTMAGHPFKRASLLFANFFFIMLAYYQIKPVPTRAAARLHISFEEIHS